MAKSRDRLIYLALAAATIGVGLGVHLGGWGLSFVLRDVLGDALWAAMVFWWAGALAPRAGVGARALGAVVFSYSIELSQLWHTPALDALRRTTVGHLVLGSGFDVRDLVAYAGGVGAAALVDRGIVRRLVRGRSGAGPSP